MLTGVFDKFMRHTLRAKRPTCDGLYRVWLWKPTWIYVDDVNGFLVKSHLAIGRWVMRREGTFIGVVHEPIERWERIKYLEETFKGRLV